MEFIDIIYESAKNAMHELYARPICEFPREVLISMFGDIDVFEQIKLQICDEFSITKDDFMKLPYFVIVGGLICMTLKYERTRNGGWQT